MIKSCQKNSDTEYKTDTSQKDNAWEYVVWMRQMFYSAAVHMLPLLFYVHTLSLSLTHTRKGQMQSNLSQSAD